MLISTDKHTYLYKNIFSNNFYLFCFLLIFLFFVFFQNRVSLHSSSNSGTYIYRLGWLQPQRSTCLYLSRLRLKMCATTSRLLLLIFYIIHFMCVLSACMYVPCGACGGQRRASDPLELWTTWMAGIEPRFYEKVQVLLTAELSCQAHTQLFFKIAHFQKS